MGVFFLPHLGDIFILPIGGLFSCAVSHRSIPLLDGRTKAGRALISSKTTLQFLPAFVSKGLFHFDFFQQFCGPGNFRSILLAKSWVGHQNSTPGLIGFQAFDPLWQFSRFMLPGIKPALHFNSRPAVLPIALI